ncbi:MAG: hypothetical protein OHK0039_22920 [Bacteroidia bacterium]
MLLLGYCTVPALRAQFPDFTSGIVAYYPFNGNADDMSSQGHDAIVNGARLATDRFGEANAAYDFDGIKQGLRIPYAPELDFSRQSVFSISLWIQPRDINSGCIILRNFDYGIKWNTTGQPLTLFSGTQGGYPNATFGKWRSQEWYHLAMVQRAGELLLYINGALDTRLPIVHKTQAGQDDIYLGNHPYFWSSFAGRIDDLILYNRDLSDIEIQTLYQIQRMPLEVKMRPRGPDLDPRTIAGVWQGVLTQPANREVSNYAFWLRVEQKGASLDGASRIEIGATDAYGVTATSFAVNRDELVFREAKVLSQKNYEGFEWCKKFGKLYYDPADQSLRGQWYADNCQKGGEIVLFRSQQAFNYYDNRLSAAVPIDRLLAELTRNKALKAEERKVIKLNLKPIEFQVSQAVISTGSQDYLLAELVPILKANPEIRLYITGHTDSAGDDTYNLELSKRRADAIVEFLVQQGVDRRRLTSDGFGESKPIASNQTPEGRKLNRRVEFEVLTE